MAESTRLVDLVQSELDAFLDVRAPILHGIAPELDPFIRYSRELLRGGKRFRAQFCVWGWQATGAHSPSSAGADAEGVAPAVIRAASALEIFHAAALVHDDIMDNSDTRRGLPAVHRRFESMHVEGSWVGDAEEFGRSAALLLGDLLLGWSDELFDAGATGMEAAAGLAARREFNSMRTEVTVGQYLDILDERAWQSYPEIELLPRAQRVIVYKSAKYSIEAPLAIGAHLGGGTAEQVAALREFGLPLGIAFQLRDDILGVFGDPAVTGKPAGDDLREGKRTVLVARARESLDPAARSELDRLLGDPLLAEDQVRGLQDSISSSGAVGAVEEAIDRNVAVALAALERAPIEETARAGLASLADSVIRRSA